MRLLWNETRRIERFLRKQLSLNSQTKLEEQLKTDAAFAEKTIMQERTYRLITQISRRQLKREIQALEARILQEHPHLQNP